MIATVNPQLWWWLARASGIVAWCMVTASIVWGLALSSKLVRRRKVPAWLLDLHKYLGTLSLAFIAVHLVALVADSYVDFGPRTCSFRWPRRGGPARSRGASSRCTCSSSCR